MLKLELIKDLRSVPTNVPLLTVPVTLKHAKELPYNTTTVYNATSLATVKGSKDGHIVNVDRDQFKYNSYLNTWINYNLAEEYLVRTGLLEIDYTIIELTIQSRKAHRYPSKLIDSALKLIGRLETSYKPSIDSGRVSELKKDTQQNIKAKFKSFTQTLNM